jgi:hypothetical protein
MNIDEDKEKIYESFADFACKYPNDALPTITTMFVSFAVFVFEECGGDINKEIVIEGGKRKITISAINEDE